MKKLNSEFAVKLGEEIELTISSVNMLHQPIVLLDGTPVEPDVTVSDTVTYKFQVAKPVGHSHLCVVELPTFDLHKAPYKVELLAAGERVEYDFIKAADRQGFGNLIYTFSTHGSGGGAND